MASLVRRKRVENIEKKNKTERSKTLKNEEGEKWKEEEKWKILGKSINNKKHHWFYLLYKKNYILLESIIWKKAVSTFTFYLHFLCVAGYLNRSNDVPKLNIHKYTNYKW